MNAGHELFGRLETGEEVHRITIRGGGLEVKVITWGAVIQDLRLQKHQPPLVCVPERYCEIAFQLLNEIQAALFIQMNDGFRVGARAITVALFDKTRP